MEKNEFESIPDYLKGMSMKEARICYLLSGMISLGMSPLGMLLALAIPNAIIAYFFIHYQDIPGWQMIRGSVIIIFSAALVLELFFPLQKERAECKADLQAIKAYMLYLKKQKQAKDLN